MPRITNALRVCAVLSLLVAPVAQAQTVSGGPGDLVPQSAADAIGRAVTQPANGVPTVRIVYLVPSDRPIRQDYIDAVTRGVRRLQEWMSTTMGNGKSFRLLPQPVEYYRTPHKADYYVGDGSPGFSWFYKVEADGFALTGGSVGDTANHWVFYMDSDSACGQAGGNGWDSRAIVGRGDLDGMLSAAPYNKCGQFITAPVERWIGGLGHELLHTFNIPHPAECEANLSTCPYNALMSGGYSLWPDSLVLPSERATLDASPFFTTDWRNAPATTCTYQVTGAGGAFPAAGGSGTAQIAASAPTCAWSVVPNASWITVAGPTSGTGSATITYTVAAATTNRSSTLAVAGQPIYMSQDPDTDGDGLPHSFESATGLDPANATGVDGADGDPDGDGRTNRQEMEAGTHPRGFYRRYLAEGADNAFFTTRLALFSVGNQIANVQVRLLQPGGATISQYLQIWPSSRRSVTHGDLLELTSADFSTVVESDQPIVVDRTMWWGANGYGSHAETAVASPSTTWYLAEGATTGDFSLFYLLQNAGDSAVSATVRFLRPFGLPPIDRAYSLPARSRTTIPVDDAGPELAATDVSAVIQASAPIMVERAMYATRAGQAFAAGHDSAGVIAPATSWFLAEGATGPFFDLFILLANPGNQPASVTIDYLLSTGETHTKTYTVPANGRSTVWVDNEELPAGSGVHPFDNVAVSSEIRSTVPIVVERTMWWPSPALGPAYWTESHNSPGATETGTTWALAEGEVGGRQRSETYILIANPSTNAGSVRVTFYAEEGGAVQREYALRPRSRTTVNVGADFPLLADRRFSATVVSLGASPVPIVVERAMYSSAGGTWAAGTNALATRLR